MWLNRHVAIAALAVIVGLAGEAVAFGWREPQRWLPDLLVGWTFAAGGLVVSLRSPGNRIGALLTATGFAWFAGNFEGVAWAPAAWLAGELAFVHRGLIIHAIVAFPDGRLGSRAARAAVAGGYTASLGRPANTDAVTMAAGGALIVGALVALVHRRGTPPKGPAIAAALLFGGVLVIATVIRAAAVARAGDARVLRAYEAVLCVVALVLSAGALERAGARAEIPNLVVELGDGGSDSLRAGLARALGDPSLRIGYWVAGGDRLVDAAGSELALPRDGPAEAITMVERAGRPVAAIVHDPIVLDDPALVGAVSHAAGLAAANARLQATVREQLAELQTSRRRLLDAGDDERRRLERRLHDGVEQDLAGLAGTLERVSSLAAREPPAPGVAENVRSAQEQLTRTLTDLGAIARGLHPRELAAQGLAGALRELAAESAVHVEVTVADTRLPPAVEVTVYFVCAEGLANIAKHASASRAWIDVRRAGGHVTVSVRDNGAGGADPHIGGGLRGIADRVAALGGMLGIDSSPGRGTSLVADIPSPAGGAR